MIKMSKTTPKSKLVLNSKITICGLWKVLLLITTKLYGGNPSERLFGQLFEIKNMLRFEKQYLV